MICAELSVNGRHAEVNLIAGGGGVVGSRCARFVRAAMRGAEWFRPGRSRSRSRAAMPQRLKCRAAMPQRLKCRDAITSCYGEMRRA